MPDSDKTMYFTSFIDPPLWDKAQWRGTAFGWDPTGNGPPFIGLIFMDPKAGREIFDKLKNALGPEDKNEALRISVVEGPIEGQGDGYSVLIGTDPDGAVKRAREQGIENPNLLVSICRVNRMNPSPNSPNLPNFKKAYAKHGRYVLMQVVMKPNGPEPAPETAIAKKKVNLRNAKDVGEKDVDSPIFLKGGGDPN